MRDKLFIAGETGLVGGALVRRFSREPVDILSAPHRVLDLTDRLKTFDWFHTHRPDHVIMAAGRVGGIGANTADPSGFYHDNWTMARNVLDAAVQAGVKKLIYLGSSCIYPRNASQPLTPDALFKGRLEKTNQGYALAKLKGIRLAQRYGFIPVLPCNLYGEGDHYDVEGSHVIPALILKIHTAKITRAASVTLWGTGTPLREFLHVEDLAEACVSILNHYEAGSLLNVGSGMEVTIRELAMTIARVIGYNGRIEFDSSKSDGTPRKLLQSNYRAEIELEDGLRRAYADYLSRQSCAWSVG